MIGTQDTDVEETTQTHQTNGSRPLGWFALGIVLGAAIMLAVMTIRGATGTTTSIDAATIRTIVRDELNAALKETSAQGSQSPSNSAASADSPATTQKVNVPLSNNIVGSANAPVTMIEYSDFQCPFCGRFQRDVYPKVYANYIKTGKVKFVYKNFAFLGQGSTQAAVAAECAADQGKFWEYHDKVFASQNGENQGVFGIANLVKFAEELKLDKAKFEDCVTNNKTLDRVKNETAEGRRIGVTGTPHFLINGTPLVGAQPWESFQKAIDQVLQRAQ